jgi:hypothetical protein
MSQDVENSGVGLHKFHCISLQDVAIVVFANYLPYNGKRLNIAFKLVARVIFHVLILHVVPVY